VSDDFGDGDPPKGSLDEVVVARTMFLQFLRLLVEWKLFRAEFRRKLGQKNGCGLSANPTRFGATQS